VKPDVLILEDGHKFSIAELEEDLVQPLVDLAFSGTATKDIPDICKGLKIKP
jgi:hypothetical protein